MELDTTLKESSPDSWAEPELKNWWIKNPRRNQGTNITSTGHFLILGKLKFLSFNKLKTYFFIFFFKKAFSPIQEFPIPGMAECEATSFLQQNWEKDYGADQPNYLPS